MTPSFNPKKEHLTVHGLHEASFVQKDSNGNDVYYRADFSPIGSPVQKSEPAKIKKLSKPVEEPKIEETVPLNFDSTKPVALEPINLETCKRPEMIGFLGKAKKPFTMKMTNPELLELCKEVNDGLENR